MKKNKRFTIICVLLVIVMIIYVLSATITYSLDNQIQDLEAANLELQQEIDTLQIRINTSNSREKILEQHPDIHMQDNIFYLDEANNE